MGVAFCNSTNYYGWTPNRELVYRYESQVLTGIPEIRDSQFAGLRLSAEVRVQSFSDYSLRVRFEQTRYRTFNGNVEFDENGFIRNELRNSGNQNRTQPADEIPAELKTSLERPFVVHLKRGLVATFYVDATEPSTVTDVRRSFLSQIQLDFTGNRRNDAENVRSSFPVGSKSLEQEPGLHSFGAAMIYRAWPRL